MKSKLIYVIFILIILFKGYFFTTKYTSDDYDKEYTLKIESIKEIAESKVSYYARLNKDKFILNIYSNSYGEKINIQDYTNFKYGDFVKVKGKIISTKTLNNPGEFNYKLYLYSINTHGTISTYTNIQKVQCENTIIDRIYMKIYLVRERVEKSIDKSLNAQASAVKALVYGDDTSLKDNLKESFSNIGISHLMSVSGTHVATFLIIISLLFKKKEKIGWVRATISIVSILIYVMFTGFSISSTRSLIMTSAILFLKCINVKPNKWKILNITFLLMLLHTPFAIFNLGFQLSFLAVLGIYLLYKNINQLVISNIKLSRKTKLYKILKYIISCVTLTISVKLLILPVEINAFNKLSFPVVISNFLIGLVSTIIMLIGMVGIMFSCIPPLSSFIFTTLKPFVSLFLFLVNTLNKISFSISLADISPILICVYYILIILLYILLKLKNIKNKEKSKYNLNKLYLVVKKTSITISMLLTTLVILQNVYFKNYSKEIYFFNVEQGDMSYVKYMKESIIVDIGSLREGLASNVISAYFKKCNLNSVDVILISHIDRDHVNGLEEVINNFKVGKVVLAKQEEITEEYNNFLEVLNKYSVDYEEVIAGDKIELENIKIHILLPDNEYIKSDNLNTNSIICKVEVGNKSILYMGDADESSEKKLMDKYQGLGKIDILKVGHHGSKTSTSYEFIEYLKPKYSVISAKSKYYGHPHESVLETLKEFNVMIHITEKVGAIKFNLN